MTSEEKQKVHVLQLQGYGYKKISTETGISVNTVKSYCRTHPVLEDPQEHCPQCGAVISQTPHKRRRRFCSDRCRSLWWTAHPEMRKSGRPYEHICLHCGQLFSSDRTASKYCSIRCFANARRKEQTV